MQSLFYPVNHGSGGRFEKAEQNIAGIGGQIGFEKSGAHQLHPAVASSLIDRKGHVTHTQAGMAARIDVSLWTAKPINEKAAQTFFSAGKIAAAIHRAKYVVARDLLVECRDEPFESFRANGGVDFVFFHRLIVPEVAPGARHRASDRGPGQSTWAR
jgi:hypothetical protein